MTGIQLALILIYTCVLLLKTCSMSSAVCSTFGFGHTSQGAREHTQIEHEHASFPSLFTVMVHKSIPRRSVHLLCLLCVGNDVTDSLHRRRAFVD